MGKFYSTRTEYGQNYLRRTYSLTEKPISKVQLLESYNNFKTSPLLENGDYLPKSPHLCQRKPGDIMPKGEKVLSSWKSLPNIEHNECKPQRSIENDIFIKQRVYTL